MNRLFGKGKDKVPPPNLGDQVANVSFIFLVDLLLILGLNDQAKKDPEYQRPTNQSGSGSSERFWLTLIPTSDS